MRNEKEATTSKPTGSFEAMATINQVDVIYQKEYAKSSRNLRYEIGELLWCLQFPLGEMSQVGWGLFERMLRRYISLKRASKCLSEPLESTISGQGVSG